MRKKRFLFLCWILILTAIVPLLSACGGDSITVIMMDNVAVKRSDLMLHIFNTKYALYSEQIASGTMKFEDLYSMSDSFLDSIYSSGVTYGEYIKQNAAQSAVTSLLYRTLAKEEGITLTSADKTSIKNSIEDFKKSLGGNKGFNKFLTENQTTENAMKRFYSDQIYLEKLQKLFSEFGKYELNEEELAKAREEYETTYYTVDYVYWSKRESAVGLLLGDEAIAKKYALAKECLSKLKAGNDFYQIRKQYTEDEYHTLTFCKGLVSDAIFNAASQLRIGQFSKIVDDDEQDCFYIIHRIELTDDEWQNYRSAIEKVSFDSYVKTKMNEKELDYKSAYKELEFN